MKPGLTKKILKYALIVSVVIAAAYALLWLILQGYSVTWTGFKEFTKPDSNFVPRKTLWDWMQLFIIPIFLSVGVFLLNRSERETERKRAEERANLERQRGEERANLEREIATDRQHEAALQAYLDRMADLLLKEKLRTTQNEDARDVARIRTLTVLRGLDSTRKRLVVLFLLESGLILEDAIIQLNGADLNDANFRKANLKGANLTGAELNSADLSSANLTGANLTGTELNSADLASVNLEGANLTSAELNSADLSSANLTGANLTDAELNSANLSGANLTRANLNGAELNGAELNGIIWPNNSEHN